MVTTTAPHKTHHVPPPERRVLVVGNPCHDVLIQNGSVKAETLGGAASFISNVFKGLSVPFDLVSKVGHDFRYQTTTPTPAVVPKSVTTLFHAYFNEPDNPNRHQDRVLKRVAACDPIRPGDLPDRKFDFGMAVGVGGEILPETLERMVELCGVVFVDIQSLIRAFGEADGAVRLVKLAETGFHYLLPRIGVIKASSEEAMFMDVEEVRRWCCVVVTNGRNGCKVYWKDGEIGVPPFSANQEDPTGAGDSFLGGFVAGLVQGLSVPDAALLGNLFGSLTVEQIGLPKFDPRLLQRVKDEVQKRRMQCLRCEGCDSMLKLLKLAGHEQFHCSLRAAKLLPHSSVQECHSNLPRSPSDMENGIVPHFTEQPM